MRRVFLLDLYASVDRSNEVECRGESKSSGKNTKRKRHDEHIAKIEQSTDKWRNMKLREEI